MKVEILTLFPELFQNFLSTSLIGKAIEAKRIEVKLKNIRDFADPPHYHVDDTPYGGGPGMVMRPEPLAKAIESAKHNLPSAEVILLTPCGERFAQETAAQLSALPELILICARYEGIDERIIETFVNREISIGDYILMGGEVPAMVVLEATARLIDGVVGNSLSTVSESFASTPTGKLLEAPQYTKPAEFRGRSVPPVLLSGDHSKIAKWRSEKSIERTETRRPDLLLKNGS